MIALEMLSPKKQKAIRSLAAHDGVDPQEVVDMVWTTAVRVEAHFTVPKKTEDVSEALEDILTRAEVFTAYLESFPLLALKHFSHAVDVTRRLREAELEDPGE